MRIELFCYLHFYAYAERNINSSCPQIGMVYLHRLQNDEEWERDRRYKTKNNILVRSKIEKIIADFLFEQSIRFIYEPKVF